MALKLVKRNKIAVTVKGTLPDEDGKPVNFDFKLHCKRLTQDEIDNAMKNRKGEVKGFIREVAQGWEGVLDEVGAPVPFSAEILDDQINEPGMPVLIMQAYLEQLSATAKN